MRIKKTVLPFIFLMFFGQLNAQETDSTAMENYEFLRGQKTIDIEFRFDNVRIGLMYSEENYINRHAEKAESKNEGDGKRWRRTWQDAKKLLYPSKFINGFNFLTKEQGLIIDTSANDARYLLTVRTLMIAPNFKHTSNGTAQTSNSLTLQYEFLDRETAEVIAKYTIPLVGTTKIGGQPFGSKILAFEVVGISTAYEQAGKKLGKQIYKMLKHKKKKPK